MTPEEVWRKACAAYEDAAEEHPEMPLRDMVIAGDNAAVSVIRTAMEAYAAEKVADVLAACPAATSMHGCPSYRPEPRHD